MKRKSIGLKLGVVALALTMITTSVSSGTYAKYTDSLDATSAAIQVASWNVQGSAIGKPTVSDNKADLDMSNVITKIDENGKAVNKDGDEATTANTTFNFRDLLVSTIEANTADSTHQGKTVKADKIAPGMKGVLGVKVDADGSDVAVMYQILAGGEGTLPIGLRLTEVRWVDPDGNGPEPAAWTATKANNWMTLGAATPLVPGIIPAGGYADGGGAGEGRNQRTLYIMWEWPYEASQKIEGTTYNEDSMNAFDTAAGSDPSGYDGTMTVSVVMTQVNPEIDVLSDTVETVSGKKYKELIYTDAMATQGVS